MFWRPHKVLLRINKDPIENFLESDTDRTVCIVLYFVMKYILSEWRHIDGLVQETPNSIANALELCLSCTIDGFA